LQLMGSLRELRHNSKENSKPRFPAGEHASAVAVYGIIQKKIARFADVFVFGKPLAEFA